MAIDGSAVTGAAGDHAVAAVASRQHGVISHRQLVAAGVSPRALEHRVRSGRLHRLHRGVYAVGHVADAPLPAAAAALLACGHGAVLSHRSAAAVWGIVDRSPTPIEVTMVGRDCGLKPGIRHRRAQGLHPVDRRVHAGLPLTAPARTLLDLAAVLGPPALRRAVNEVLVAQLAREDDLHEALARGRGRRGGPRLGKLLAEGQGTSVTRSEAERRLLDLLAKRGLPVPETNVKLGRYEVDLLWRGQLVVVEVDGFAFHGTRSAFERDRARDADLQADGYAVVRVTWRQIVERPAVTGARIERLLRARVARLPTV